MATSVVDIIKVKMDDGSEIECKPLKISKLRKFMSKIADLEGLVDDNEKTIDVLMDCVQIALVQYTGKEYSVEELEEMLDLAQVYRIVEGASGIVLDDDAPPN